MTKFETKEIISGGGLDFEFMAPKVKRSSYYIDYIDHRDPNLRREQSRAWELSNRFVNVMQTGARIRPSIWSLVADLMEPKDMARTKLRFRCDSSEEIISAITHCHIDPADYAARETVSLARVFAWSEVRRIIYAASPLTTMLFGSDSSFPVEYEPRWEPPYLVWHYHTWQGTYIQHKTRIE